MFVCADNSSNAFKHKDVVKQRFLPVYFDLFVDNKLNIHFS